MINFTPGEQTLVFTACFLALGGSIWFFDLKSMMLRDTSTAAKKPYSFARVQLAWWTVIVLSSFITIMITRHYIPTLDSSTLILLGISAATTGIARVIDQGDLNNPSIVRGQDANSQGILLDILSDNTGPNLQRFQTVLFNAVFGIYFIVTVIHNLPTEPVDIIMPVITTNNLILIGLSSGTYAALKTTENKPGPAMADTVPDESLQPGQGAAQTPAQGPAQG